MGEMRKRITRDLFLRNRNPRNAMTWRRTREQSERDAETIMVALRKHGFITDEDFKNG